MLYVGQRVVCVDDRHGAHLRPPVRVLPTEALPRLGVVYTVRAIIPCRELYGYDDDALHLVEIVNPPRPSPSGSPRYELGFRVSRFRPVRTTNIDVFLKMLEPIREVEVA